MSWAFDIMAAFAICLVSLGLWRQAVTVSDGAVLALLPLAVVVFLGVFRPLLAARQASLRVVLRPGGRLAGIVTGRFGALGGALLFTLVAVPVLAFTAIRADRTEGLALVLLFVTSCAPSVGIRAGLGRSITDSHSRLWGHRIAAVVAGTLFSAVLFWLHWAVISRPGAVAGQGFAESLQAAILELPPRSAWLRVVLEPFAVIEAAKLWLATAMHGTFRAGMVYSLDAALVGFVVARCAVAALDFTESIRAAVIWRAANDRR